MTYEQVFLPQGAAPSTHPRSGDTQVIEVALNPFGTGVGTGAVEMITALPLLVAPTAQQPALAGHITLVR
jgi:hypothetical protein